MFPQHNREILWGIISVSWLELCEAFGEATFSAHANSHQTTLVLLLLPMEVVTKKNVQSSPWLSSSYFWPWPCSIQFHSDALLYTVMTAPTSQQVYFFNTKLIKKEPVNWFQLKENLHSLSPYVITLSNCVPKKRPLQYPEKIFGLKKDMLLINFIWNTLWVSLAILGFSILWFDSHIHIDTEFSTYHKQKNLPVETFNSSCPVHSPIYKNDVPNLGIYVHYTAEIKLQTRNLSQGNWIS